MKLYHFPLSGHSHRAREWTDGPVRRLNPGALVRARPFTVALLDLAAGAVQFLEVPR